MDLRNMIGILVILIVGILSTGLCLDNSSSSNYTTHDWDPANLTESKQYSERTRISAKTPSISSTIIRSRMEMSTSSISPTPPASQNTAQAPYPQQSFHYKRSTTHGQGKASKPQLRNKPLLNSVVTKLDLLVSKMEELSQTQLQIQKSFDNLEARYSISSSGTDELPQCGRRVDRVLRTLTPLVSRVEGLWNLFSNRTTHPTSVPITSGPSQFLGPPPNDILLAESRRQERAISAIRNDLSIKTSQIMSELGTVEEQLDVIQTNFNKHPGPPILTEGTEQPEQLSPELSNSNEISISSTDASTSSINSSFRLPNLVFPSVRNKPIADSNNIGLDAFLTGPGQTVSSCAELIGQGFKRSGLYHLRLPGARSSFWQLLAFCDQETAGGGWMVIQRRADFGEPRETFHRTWVEYRSGFGDPLKELWMGNLNLHLLTTAEDQILRIELEDFDGERRYAEYSTFKVASEADGFRLEVSGYSGDAGDALSDPWYGAHGSAFSTNDRDNDRSSLNCASMLKGGWWWKSCGRGLNGIYFDAPQPDSALARQGIVWFRWKGWDYTLRKAIMMIRPKNFRHSHSGNATRVST